MAALCRLGIREILLGLPPQFQDGEAIGYNACF